MRNLQLLKAVKPKTKIILTGRVTKIAGLVVEADGPLISIGSRCTIRTVTGTDIYAEIIGFRDDRVVLMPYGENEGIAPGSIVSEVSDGNKVFVGESLLGRVLDGFGNPMDGKGPLIDVHPVPISAAPPPPLLRRVIKTPISTGVKAIDGLLTSGSGQRVGIFAGSGVGKSVLLGMIARNTSAQVNVIALIGERGREVIEPSPSVVPALSKSLGKRPKTEGV